MIFTSEISRIARHPSISNKFIEDMLACNVPVYIQNMRQSSMTESRARNQYFFIMCSIISEFAFTESEYTKARMSSGKKHNFKEGRFIGGHLIRYGYEKDIRDDERKGAKLIINNTEAKVVKEIFEMCIDGVGMYTIAKQLNIKKIPTKTGKKWVSSSISQILHGTIYYGARSFKGELFEGIVPAIISKQTWNKAQEAAKQRDNTPDRNVKYLYILKNKIQCGCCGGPYTPSFKVNRQSHYTCFTRVMKGVNECNNLGIGIMYIESVVWHIIKNGVGITNYLKNSNVKLKSNNTEINHLELKLEGLKYEISKKEKERENWYRLFVIEKITEEKMIIEQERIEVSMSTLLSKINMLKEDIDVKKKWVVKFNDTKHYKSILNDIGEDRVKINQIIQDVVDKVIITGLYRETSKGNCNYYIISAFVYGQHQPIDTYLFDKKNKIIVALNTREGHDGKSDFIHSDLNHHDFDIEGFSEKFQGIPHLNKKLYKPKQLELIPFKPINILRNNELIVKNKMAPRKQKRKKIHAKNK